MQIKFEQLAGHLNKSLASCYLISGDETLIVQEAADAIRDKERVAGGREREVMEEGAEGDWKQLLQSAGSLSLFADRKLIELRLPSG